MTASLWIFALSLATWLLFWITRYRLEPAETGVVVAIWTFLVFLARRLGRKRGAQPDDGA